METKANYVLIGAFTLAGMLGILGIILWFARIELDSQFAYYDVKFTSVSGLSAASDVRFSGLPVGQVVDVQLSPERDGTITVRLEVVAETPVRTDSVATIESQGVTGVSYVGIAPGTPETPLLWPASDGGIPEIAAGRSALQSLTEDAPELVSETLQVVQEIGDLFRGENEGRLDRVLVNIEAATEEFTNALQGFSGIAETVDDFTDQIARFNTTLDTLTGEFSVVLASANETLESIDLLADQATAIVASGTDTLDLMQGAFGEAEDYVATDLVELTDAARGTLAHLESEITALRAEAGALMSTLSDTGATATSRLQEAETTIARTNALLASLESTATAVEAAAAQFDGLIEDEGRPLLVESRAVVASAGDAIQRISALAETDLPEVMADIRAATSNVRSVVDSVGADLSDASGGLADLIDQSEVTLSRAAETFSTANQTLGEINAALDTGQRTLAAAEGAFASADALISDDISVLVADLRSTVDGLNAAVGTVSGDLPLISADLRSASQAAAEAFVRAQGLVDDAAPGVRDFTTTALPLYTLLAQETRTLIDNIDQLTQRISRNPTQFFLDREVPDFRR